MGGHGYSGQSDTGPGFHSGHFVHMRGLPFRATENDIAKVSLSSVGGSEEAFPTVQTVHPVILFIVLLSFEPAASPH